MIEVSSSRRRLNPISLLLFYFFVSLLSSSTVWAESIDIYGFLFQVDEITEIGSNSIKVIISGRSRIVARKQLKNYVVQESFRQAKLPFSFRDVQRFTLIALDKNDQQTALAGFQGLLRSPELRNSRMIELIQQIAKKPAGLKFLKRALSDSENIKKHSLIGASLVFHIGMQDLFWLRSSAVSHVYLFRRQLKKYYIDRFYYSISRNDLQRSERILKFASDLFGENDADYEHLLLTKDKVVRLFAAVRNGQPTKLQTSLEKIKKDRILSENLSSVVVKEIHYHAEKLLEEKNNTLALRLLSLIDVHWRTPATHQIALNIIQHSSTAQTELLLDPRVDKFLLTLANKDERVREAMINFLEEQILQLLAQNQFQESEYYFNKLIQFRPDPDSQNDILRVRQALLLDSQGKERKARDKLDDINTVLPVWIRLRVLFSGLLVSYYLLSLVIIIPLGIGFLINRRLARFAAVESEDREGEERINRHQILSKMGMSSLSPKVQEYHRCLKVFDLPNNVELKTIKQVYRNAVKEVHPDSNPGQTSEDNRFIELSTVYEKILKLRKELGIDES